MVNRMTIDLRLAGWRDLSTNWTPPPIPLQNINAKRFSTSESTTPIVYSLNASTTIVASINEETPPNAASSV